MNFHAIIQVYIFWFDNEQILKNTDLKEHKI